MRNLIFAFVCALSATTLGCGSSSSPTVDGGDGGGNACAHCTGTCCNNLCVDVSIDAKNCGACGTICPAGSECISGHCQCGTGFCTGTQACCSSQCKDVKVDALNCGACGVSCQAGQSCVNGACGTPSCNPACAANQSCCPTSTGGVGCTDVQTDVSNCGSCGNACTGGATCNAGVCGLVQQSYCCDLNAATWPQCSELDPMMAAMFAMMGMSSAKCMDASTLLSMFGVTLSVPIGVCTANLMSLLMTMNLDFTAFSSCLTPDVIQAILDALGGI